MSLVAVRNPVQEHRAFRVAGPHQRRVLQAERVVQRFDVDESRFLQRRREFQLHLRVAAAGLDVTLGAVAVQVRACSQVDVPRLVVRIDDLAQLLRRHR